MKRLRTLALAVLVASLATSGAVHAQTDETLAAEGLDESALVSLCAANATDDAELARCVDVVESILSREPSQIVTLDAEPDLLEQARRTVDEAVAAAENLDVQAAIDEVIAGAQDFDMDTAIDDALSSARDLDLPEAIDDAISAAQGFGVGASIEDGITTTRNVVDAATVWAQENSEVVCDGGSFSLGVGAAAVVGFLVGSPGLALRAFEETNKATNDVCDAVIA